MADRRFILRAILLMAAASYAQDTAVSPDTIAISSDTAAISPDTIAILSDIIATLPDTIAILSDTSAATPDRQEKTDASPNPPATRDSASAASAKSAPAAVTGGKYYGLGAGLSLGSIPLFSMWRSALVDSLSRIGISPSFERDSAAGNTGELRQNIFEAPEEFDFTIPILHISMYSVSENHAVSLGLSFFSNSKQFQAEIVPYLDTNGRIVSIYETMKFYSLTIEASWLMAIPPNYFNIKGAQNTFVSLTLGLSPIQYITRYGEVNAANGDKRMLAVADTVKKKMMPDLSANGAAASWRVGISTLKSLQNGSALEMGLYYSGAYSAYFFRDGEKIMKREIHIEEDEVDNPLSFMSNRIELKITYMIPVKREKKNRQEERQEQPVQRDDGNNAEIQQDNNSQQKPMQEERQIQQDDKSEQESEQDNPSDLKGQQEQQVQQEEAQQNE